MKVISKQLLFDEGQNGVHTYRIPTIICTKNNVVMAFTEARHINQGDAGQIDIVYRRSEDGGKTFGEIITLLSNGKDTLGNPAPIYDEQNNRIVLLHCFNYGHLDERVIRTIGATRDIYTLYSDDEGLTWTTPVNITKQIKHPNWRWYATGPNHGVQMDSGRLIMTCNHNEENIINVETTDPTSSHIIYSDDHGVTWNIGASAVGKTNECCGVKLPNNQLLVNMRTRYRGNVRGIFISNDEGETIDEFHIDPNLVCPVCQASIINYNDLLIFSNPDSTERENMTVKISDDYGVSWKESLVLHKGAAAYSDLAVNKDNKVLCLYENGEERPYQRITLVTLEV